MGEKVVIIGGGVIGLTSAYYLQRKGVDVTLVDMGEFGQACSKGNMGWVCPPLSAPVPSPGVVGTSLKWMMKRDSPLFIKPSAVPRMSKWLFQFWRHCNIKDFESGKHALFNLNQNAYSLFDDMESAGVEFEMHKKGMLFVFLNEFELKAMEESLRYGTQTLGYHDPIILTAEEVQDLEPNISSKVVGGILLPDQRHINPESFNSGLIKWLKANGVKLLSNTKITGFKQEENKIILANTNSTSIEGDKFCTSSAVSMIGS